MKQIAILGGRVIDPAQDVDRITDLYIADGKIIAYDQPPADFTAHQTIAAAGLIVCPGLIDIRARTREPGLEYKATIASETAAALHGGITRICCPPDTEPVIDNPAMAHMVQQRARLTGNAIIHPLGALTQGLDCERISNMAALAEAGCVGVSNGLAAIRNSLVMRRAMQYAQTCHLTVFLHSLDPWLAGNGCVHEGEVSTRLGLPAVPEAAETVAVARDLALIEQTGCRAHFCQLTSARAVSMVATAQQRGLDITADVAIHHLHLCEQAIGYFDTACHVMPPLRSEQDQQALRTAVQQGIIGIICSDHQPHEPDAKLAPFSESAAGISGLETLLALTLQLVDEGLLNYLQALACLTSAPAKLLQLDAGHLRVGASADLCLLHPQQPWTLKPQMLQSKGHNSPFIGSRFNHRVVMTLINGHIAYSLDHHSPCEGSG